MAPNLPILTVLFDATQGVPNNASANAVGLDNGSGRGVGKVSWKRGRQYELGSAQAGTATVEVSDPQETLNPANSSSPLNSGGSALAPYRPLAVRAWWPRIGNMLDAHNYASYHPGYETAGVTNLWTTSSPGAALTNVTTPAPFEGTRCLQLVLGGPSATVQPNGGPGYLTIPGMQHTYSVYARRDSTSTGSTISVTASPPGGTTVTSASTTSTSFVRLSVTFTATTAITPMTLNVTGGPSGSGAQKIYIDAEQLELGPTATAYAPTGMVYYRRFSGFVERYPQTWTDAGYRGLRPLEAVDALSPLSRAVIRQSYDALITADAPILYMPFDEPATPAVPAIGPVQIHAAEYLSTAGGTYGWAADQQPDGAKALTVSQQVQDPATTPYSGQINAVDTRLPVGAQSSQLSISSTGATIEFWARITDGACTVQVQQVASGDFNDGSLATDAGFDVKITNAGYSFVYSDAGTYATRPANLSRSFDGTNWPDGGWHYYAYTLYPQGGTSTTVYDVFTKFDTSGTVWTWGKPHRYFGINSIHIDARTLYGDRLSKISIGRIAVYNRDIGDTARANHYQRGIGYSGEAADARAIRLLNAYWAGPGFVSSGSGLTLPADFSYDGRSVLDVLTEITTTDRGLVYVDGAGTVQVESRLTRYGTHPISIAVLGENTAAGELPYTALEYDYDPTYVYSDVALTRPGNNQPYQAYNSATRALVGQRVLSVQLQVLTDFDLAQAAIYYLARYGTPRLRIRKLTLDPGSNPALWPFVLGAEISQRVTVNRRTSAGTTVTADYYIESISEQVDAAAGTWTVDYELSPVFITQTSVLGNAASCVLGSTTVPVY